LAAQLSGLRASAGVTALAEVDLDALFGVEVAVGFRFADDILATFASRVPALEEAGMTVAGVVGHCGQLRDLGARGDLIGVAATDGQMWAIDKRHATSASTLLVPVTRSRVGAAVELAHFVREVAGEAQAVEHNDVFSLHRKPPMAEAGGRRVRHGKFGLGTAFSESGLGPKRVVTCDFPGLGLKKIQARFLEFLD